MTLDNLLEDLASKGCFPCISYRGGCIFRAHVNGAGNYWADATTPLKALVEATKIWQKAGKPMDGYGAKI